MNDSFFVSKKKKQKTKNAYNETQPKCTNKQLKYYHRKAIIYILSVLAWLNVLWPPAFCCYWPTFVYPVVFCGFVLPIFSTYTFILNVYMIRGRVFFFFILFAWSVSIFTAIEFVHISKSGAKAQSNDNTLFKKI